MKKTTYLIFLFLLGGNIYSQSKIYDLETIEKTMYLFENIVNEQNSHKNLSYICSEPFYQSKQWDNLLKAVNDNKINLAYVKEEITKEFKIKNSSEKLFLIFEKGESAFWYIKDAYLWENGHKKNFKAYGLKPLASEFNFVDLLDAIDNKSIQNYSGIAPNGKLSLDFLNKNSLTQTNSASAIITDIIVYQNGIISGIYYFKISYSDTIVNNKRGWLITDFGKMSELREDNLLICYLMGNTENINLNKNGKYHYSNVKSRQENRKSNVKEIVITKNDVNIRVSPSTSSGLITKGKLGDNFSILQVSKLDELIINNSITTAPWYQIKINGYTGWIFGYYCEIISTANN